MLAYAQTHGFSIAHDPANVWDAATLTQYFRVKDGEASELLDQVSGKAVYVDDVSGTVPMRERPGGARLYSFIDQRAAHAVIFFVVDRVTRDEDLIEINVIRRDIRNAGMELHYAADGGKADLTTWGGVIDTLKAAGAAEERKKIIERSTRGRRDKAASGKWVGQGAEPYGYRRAGHGRDSRLVIHEPEAETVRYIFGLYLGTGGKTPVSVRKLTERLTDEGVPTPARKDRSGRQNSRGWHTRSVNMLLTRRLYCGEMEYGDMVIPMPELAVISREMFEAVQERRAKNKQRHAGHRKREYLLAGHIRCTCGRAMIGKDKRDPHRYYYCAGRSLPRHLRDCGERMLRGPELDVLVWDWLCHQFDDDMLNAALDRLAARRTDELEPKRAQLTRLSAEADRLQHRIDVWTGEYPDATDAERQSLKTQVRQASSELEQVNARRERLAGEIGQGEVTERQRRGVIANAATIREKMRTATYATRRYLLDRFDMLVTMRRDETGQLWADMSCALGDEPEAVAIATTVLQTALQATPARCCDSQPAPRSQGGRSG
jgi:site-specific DNA recombinase